MLLRRNNPEVCLTVNFPVLSIVGFCVVLQGCRVSWLQNPKHTFLSVT